MASRLLSAAAGASSSRDYSGARLRRLRADAAAARGDTTPAALPDPTPAGDLAALVICMVLGAYITWRFVKHSIVVVRHSEVRSAGAGGAAAAAAAPGSGCTAWGAVSAWRTGYSSSSSSSDGAGG